MMDSNLKATLLACIFTLLLSVSTAYGILKIDDAAAKKDIQAIQEVHNKDIGYIGEQIEAQWTHISKLLEQQSAYSERSMDKLDEAIIKFTDKVDSVSNTMARLDERLKSLESGRRE